MMLPILISVSVAPVSYFFWSAALTLVTARLVTARIARAAEISPDRIWMAGMVISLDLVDCVDFLKGEHFAAPDRIQHPSGKTSKKKPSARQSRRASFSRTLDTKKRVPDSPLSCPSRGGWIVPLSSGSVAEFT